MGGRAAAALFGARIGRYFDGAIAISLLSALSAMIMTGPRVYKAFRRINSKHHTPAHAVVLQAGVAMFMVVTATFENLLLYIGFTLSLSAMLTVSGLIRIRMKHLFSPAGYKVIGYPLARSIHHRESVDYLFFGKDQAHDGSRRAGDYRFRHNGLCVFF